MKKKLVLLCMTVMAAGLIACGQAAGEQSEATGAAVLETETSQAAQVPESVQITTLDANKEEIEITVPYDPKRIAILDLAALDIIDHLGMGDRVVGTADTSIDYLLSYAQNTELKKLGTIKEADLEAVMECEPDVIFIGGRLSASYDALSEIAPVIYLATDTEIGVVESITRNATVIASLFGLESQVEETMADFSGRIEALQAVSEGKTALVGMTTSGSFNLLGDDGRCSLIGVEIGFDNLTAAKVEESDATGEAEGGSPHGNESSFETVMAENPDYIFVMDRDSAIGTEGAKMAHEIMENELIMDTDAYRNGTIVYLEHPAVWYTAEGGITALDMMLQDLEKTLL